MDHTSTPLTSSERMTTVYSIFASGGEMGALMRQINWAETPLGPVENWPQSLCTTLSICLASRFPMLIWWGPELVMLYNDAYRPMLGAIKHPNAMGQRGHECWPEIWNVIGPMLTKVITTGEATWSDNQLLLLERNGYVEECYFTYSYSPIRDENGVAGVFTAVTETTPQVLSQRRLRTLREMAVRNTEAKSAEEASRIIIEALVTNKADLPFTLLYLLDNAGTCARFAGATGINTEQVIYPETVQLLEDEIQEQMEQDPLLYVARSGKIKRIDNLSTAFSHIQVLSPLGTPVQTVLLLPVAKSGQESLYGILVVGVSPHCLLDNEYQGFLTLLAGQAAANIANVRAYEEERARAEALAELDRAKTTFFSNISHEFRTPLTLLLAPIENALSARDPYFSDEQQALLEIVYRNGRRLLKLVNTLLDFSRIEAGRVDAVYQPTDLARFTRELASSFHELMERAGLNFRVECAPLAEPVYVARDMWEKIVLNLLSNAFKFTLSGEITVTLHSENKQAVLTVSDTGVGIATSELVHIFERFHRVYGVQGRSFEGSGIGLSLVRELVHLHGGTIDVASASGVGTTFHVRLPFGMAHLPAEQIREDESQTDENVLANAFVYVEEATSWLAPKNSDSLSALSESALSGEQERPPAPASGIEIPHILLVDDNADMRDYLTRLLRPHYHVEIATNGYQAWQMLLEHKPDLIISDVMMPGMDGLQFARSIREHAGTHTIPIMLLSARAGEEAAVEGLQAGADDYLVKPFSARELLARVSSRLERVRMRQALTKQMEAHAHHLQQLANVSLVVNSLRPAEEILSMVIAKARELIGAHTAVALLSAQSDSERAIQMMSFSQKYARWREEEDFTGVSEPSLYEVLSQRDTPLRLTDMEVRAHPLWGNLYEERELHPLLHGLLGVALRGSDSFPFGMLVLSDKYEGEFTVEDEAIIVQMAQMTSIAITNVRLYQQSREAVVARDQLLSVVSHDLKNPLGTIKGYAQLLQRSLQRKTPDMERQIAFGLERINATVVKMTMQVNELLDITHLQLGQRLELIRQETDLVSLLRQCVAEFQQTTQRHTLRLSTPSQPLLVRLDVARIERVLTNLLTNAIKYSPNVDYVDITLEYEEKPVVGRQEAERWAVLQVRDYGIGIPAVDLPYIFERFKRASNVVGTYRGTGVGLANAQQIIQLHGGKIVVSSEEGNGSLFTIYLPVEN